MTISEFPVSRKKARMIKIKGREPKEKELTIPPP
jgi:hypothetical protein